MRTLSSAFIGQPSYSMSLVTTRAMVTGSSTQELFDGHRHDLGLFDQPLAVGLVRREVPEDDPIALQVVSMPAIRREPPCRARVVDR